MTDGTSQGLFIVVAIVIFGIFVVLAYILFEDTLSPAMASMFNEAVEQSNDNLNSLYTDSSYFEFDKTKRMITKYVGPEQHTIRIPEMIEGVPVEVIKSESFNPISPHHPGSEPKTKTLKKLILPNSLKTIQRTAFDNIGIKEVVFGRNIEFIGFAAFQNASIEQIRFPNSVKTIEKDAFRDSLDRGVILSKDAIVHPEAFSQHVKVTYR